MPKTIEETHPSLKDESYMYEPITGYGYSNEIIQKHTIDKAVLKDTIKKVENLTQKGNWVTLIQGYSSLGICSEEITLENSLKVATHIIRKELGLDD